MAAGPDISASFFELQRKRREEEDLQAACRERKQVLKSLEWTIDKLHSDFKNAQELHLSFEKFEDVESLSGQLENLFHFRDKLYKKGNEAQERANQQREKLVTLKDQHQLMHLQKDNKLSQLKTELEETRCETLLWERRWNHIHDIAATKTLLLGQIKMATVNLFEMAGGKLEGEECVNINDTEKQLDRIMTFIEDQEDIIKTHKTLQTGKRRGKKHK